MRPPDNIRHISFPIPGPGISPGPLHLGPKWEKACRVAALIVAKVEEAQEGGNDPEMFRQLRRLDRVNQIKRRIYQEATPGA